jgi:hypothetical protein
MSARIWLALVLAVCPIEVLADPSESGIAVIVAPGDIPPRISHEELALIFKNKKRFWDDGRRIQAVNLPPNNSLRRASSLQVLGKNPEDMDEYWRDMYFHGVLPPYVLASEEAAIRFVAGTPGAIGYISNCAVDHRVRVLMRLDTGANCTR